MLTQSFLFLTTSQKKELRKSYRPFFGPFWRIFEKILPLICSAAHILYRPLLSYAAEYSANWQRWLCPPGAALCQCNTPVLPDGRNFDQKALKGPRKNKVGRRNLWPNFSKSGRKGAE
jgi:hypothetical protein